MNPDEWANFATVQTERSSIGIDVVQMESNLPGEDRFCARENSECKAYAVFDGHGGYLAADICGKCELCCHITMY